VRGSGKSTLVDVAAVLASGRRAAVLSATGDAGELEKRIVGCLLSGDPLVSLDNLNGQLASDLLCQASTADAVKIRPLGGSGQVEIENTTLWTANGNNLVTAGDLARRSLLCRMDPGVERPEERTFAFDPVARARQHRAAYVGHALTIMRAYVVAGRPDLELVPFGSFEVWSSLVRCALVWAGAADPCASLLAAWREAFGDDQKTVREVISTAQVGDGPLADALGDIAEEGTMRFNTQRLGIWLRRNMNRVAGGLKLQRAGTARDGAAWQVVEA
jgi:putative DNA primase/helicase